MVRIINIENPEQAEKEMHAIGADSAGIRLMAPKALQRVIKIESINVVAANILKQEMLALGGEAVTARGAINHAVKETAVLICATDKQLSPLLKKLALGYFGLPEIGKEIEASLEHYKNPPDKIKIGKKVLDFSKRTYIMGILNVTPDSFSDGGKYFDPQVAISQAQKMIAVGADIIDVGGESTRPGAENVPAREEIKRVIPVIKALAKKPGIILSIDTRKAQVAEAALKAGVQMVNDVSGLRYDRKMARVTADYGAVICLMHSRGTPKNMQQKTAYSDLMSEIIEGLNQALAIGKKNGILQNKFVVDPGLGFGKTVEHNLEIINKLRELRVLGCPVLIGPSRKSFIGKILDAPADQRLDGTAAAVALAIAGGANIIRVHDVAEMKKVARIADAIVRRE